jgi:hypothetical protein
MKIECLRQKDEARVEKIIHRRKSKREQQTHLGAQGIGSHTVARNQNRKKKIAVEQKKIPAPQYSQNEHIKGG